MDIYFFLRCRLDFIRNLYEESTVSFREIKRKIEIGEEPFVDDSNPEDYDGTPPFLEEWQQADESIESLGRWCVILLANLLKTYLEEFASDMDRYYGHKFPEFTKYKEYLASLKKRKGWLLDYQSLFLSMYEIDWSRGPNLVAGLEHLVLTRNDFEHKTQLVSLYVMQDPKHREKYSDGIFTDTETRFWDGESATLKVDRERLDQAIALVNLSCKWLETIRLSYPRFRMYKDYEKVFTDYPAVDWHFSP